METPHMYIYIYVLYIIYYIIKYLYIVYIYIYITFPCFHLLYFGLTIVTLAFSQAQRFSTERQLEVPTIRSRDSHLEIAAGAWNLWVMKKNIIIIIVMKMMKMNMIKIY